MIRDSTASAQFLTVREAARRLGVHENTIRNWASNGILQSARPPGARFHRFDAAEVERIRLARATGPESLQGERRIVGPELGDATRLGMWAGTQEARHVFPRLVRRLLAATPGVEQLVGRAGEGVGISGWDVRATLMGATPWLPAGALAFELGVGASPRTKAQKEYAQRSRKPLDVRPAETAFVFATPRRWPGAAKWVADREAEGIWRSVVVVDGDALEAWLEATPAVHYWISEQVGLQPRGVTTAEQWWAQFSRRTHPTLPPTLLLAGRDFARDDLAARLAGPERSIGVRAAWRDDALAFVCAALSADAEDGAPQRPALVVSSEDVWDRVAAEPGSMTLIPLIPEPDVTAAITNGKHVVVPFGSDDVQSGDAILLPPPDRILAQKALTDVGVEFDTASRLAALSRRSMPALVRSLSVNPRFGRPVWAEPPASHMFAPLVLAGAWAETTSDLDAVSQLVGRPWAEIERALRGAADAPDPPFVQSGNTWRVASHEEIFNVLVRSLTTSDLQRWQALVVRVLLERDTRAELTIEELVTTPRELEVQPCSATFRRGLGEGLALLAAHGTQQLPGGMTCRDCAQRVVRELLDQADADESGQTWRSLAAEMPLIAEAAPGLFLERVIAGSKGAAPALATMFRDQERASAFSTSSPHTGLLWALETLCWAPDHLLESARALAQLAVIDPGGRLSNRPSGSLASVLVPWIRHTSAPLDLRIAAIDLVVREFPDVGWTLLESLWPSQHATTMPPHSPRFADWKPDKAGVPLTEWLAVIEHLVASAVEEAGNDAERWTSLVARVAPLPPAQRDVVLDAFDQCLDDVADEPEGRLQLWEALTEVIGHHRAFPTAQWAMPSALVDRLVALAERIEPIENVERFARLFDWRPGIDGIQLSDGYEKYEAALRKVSEEAVRETLATESIAGLSRLAERAPVAGRLGSVVASATGDDYRDALLSWLQGEGKKRETALAWAGSQAFTNGTAWIAGAFQDVEDDDSRLRLALQAPATPELWELLDESSPTLSARYWELFAPMGMRSEHVIAAATRLLARKRPWGAVRALATELHRPPEDRAAIKPDLVVRALQAAATSAGNAERGGDSLGYEIGVLLDFLEARQTPAPQLALLEFAFARVLQFQRAPRALDAALGEDPDLFVQLVCQVYRAKNEPRETPDQQGVAAATHAWHVLSEWRTVPGLRTDGTVDAAHLERWVDRARLLLSDRGRSDIGDEQIGQVLSGSPHGADAAWPAEAVRDLVERLGSREMENGIHVGKMNSRGVTSRGIFDGGAQERSLVAEFRAWSTITASRWPRTTRLLRELAESYDRYAAQEDMRAREDADSG